MENKFINIILKDNTNNFNLNNNEVLEFFKVSLGNDANNFNYIENTKKSSEKHLDIIYYKKYIKRNIGKIIYKKSK